MVLAAGATPGSGSQIALERLCTAYWPPLYAYVRSRGYSIEESQDLTQAYFERLLAKNYVKTFSRERGQFRSFLLASLKHFMANEYDRDNALKRGGGQVHLALDLNWDDAESRCLLDPGHNFTPERIFEQRWALTLLERARVRLAAEMLRAGKQDQFRKLGSLASGEEADVPYRDLARALDTSEGAIKVAVHRLRRRFRELLRDEVGQTVDSLEKADEELQFLLKVISGA